MLVQTSRCIVYRCDTMAACGCSRNPAILSRIVGGEAAGNGTWGSAVSIFIAGRLLCGGSIVSESWIISAAHCFHGYTASDVVIYAGSNGIFEGSQIRNASRVIIHPQYSTTTVINDIALIKLESPLLMNDSNINAICLPSAAQGSSTGNEWPIANTSVKKCSRQIDDFISSLLLGCCSGMGKTKIRWSCLAKIATSHITNGRLSSTCLLTTHI